MFKHVKRMLSNMQLSYLCSTLSFKIWHDFTHKRDVEVGIGNKHQEIWIYNFVEWEPYFFLGKNGAYIATLM